MSVSVQQYSHDSTLGKGEVLHQDVKASVLIVEELPDPPGQSESTERLSERHNPRSATAALSTFNEDNWEKWGHGVPKTASVA